MGRPGVADRCAKGGSAVAEALGCVRCRADRAAGRLRYLAARRGWGPRQLRASAGGCARTVGAVLKAARRRRLGHEPVTTGVEGETVWQVPPMSLPASAASSGALAGSDAVALFVERAARRAPLHPERRQRRVGCPRVRGRGRLAARHRARGGTAADAVGRADRERSGAALPAAQRRTRTATQRQQTLRASVQWSHEPVARRACCCAGCRCSRADSRSRPPSRSVPSTPSSGTDCRPARVPGRPVARAGLRAGLRDALPPAGDDAPVRSRAVGRSRRDESLAARHRDAFLGLAEQAGPHLETGRQREWLALLDADAANLTTAIEHSLRPT